MFFDDVICVCIKSLIGIFGCYLNIFFKEVRMFVMCYVLKVVILWWLVVWY